MQKFTTHCKKFTGIFLTKTSVCFLFRSLWTLAPSRSTSTQKQDPGQYPAILTSRLVNNPMHVYCLYWWCSSLQSSRLIYNKPMYRIYHLQASFLFLKSYIHLTTKTIKTQGALIPVQGEKKTPPTSVPSTLQLQTHFQ